VDWHIDMGHLIELAIAVITFWGITWGFHREDKKDRDRKAEEAQEELKSTAVLLEKKQEERHRENQNKLGTIRTILAYNPPHVHIEETGPLTAGGIRYGPKIPKRRDETDD
jgi:hypothetical protein